MQDDDQPEFLPPGYAQNVHGIPEDARRMGFDRNTEEGALIALASSLSPSKRSHRVVAWLILVSFVGPVLLALVTEFF